MIADLSHKEGPFVYELPVMPGNIVAELQAAKSVLVLKASTYRGVIRLLYEDMIQYTL